MAIRAGSGGLKYPIPNQAQIQASQNAAAASSGGSAAASVYGANRRYAGLKQQLRYDALQQGLNRGFRAQQAFFQREHEKGAQLSAQEARAEIEAERRKNQRVLQRRQQRFQSGENQLGRDFDAQQSQLDRQFRSDEAQRGRDFQSDEAQRRRQFEADQATLDTLDRQDELQFRRRNELEDQERIIDADIEARLRTGEFGLPDGAQERLRKLESDYARAIENPENDEADIASIQRQYQDRRRKILRTASASNAQPSSVGFNRGTVYVDAEGNSYDEYAPGTVPFNAESRTPLFGETGLIGLNPASPPAEGDNVPPAGGQGGEASSGSSAPTQPQLPPTTGKPVKPGTPLPPGMEGGKWVDENTIIWQGQVFVRE